MTHTEAKAKRNREKAAELDRIEKLENDFLTGYALSACVAQAHYEFSKHLRALADLHPAVAVVEYLYKVSLGKAAETLDHNLRKGNR